MKISYSKWKTISYPINYFKLNEIISKRDELDIQIVYEYITFLLSLGVYFNENDQLQELKNVYYLLQSILTFGVIEYEKETMLNDIINSFIQRLFIEK